MNGWLFWCAIGAGLILFGVLLSVIIKNKDKREFATFLIGAGVFVIVVASVTGVIRWGKLTVLTNECNAYHKKTNRPVQLVDIGAIRWECFAEVDGQWYPIDKIISQTPDKSNE